VELKKKIWRKIVAIYFAELVAVLLKVSSNVLDRIRGWRKVGCHGGKH
jgi:hypothetical protein